MGEFRDLFDPRSNPVLQLELRRQNRGTRRYLRAAIIGATTPVVVWTAWTAATGRGRAPVLETLELVFTWLVITTCILAGVLAGGSLAGERETRTLNILLATDLSRWQIVLGKWLASVWVLLGAVLVSGLCAAFTLWPHDRALAIGALRAIVVLASAVVMFSSLGMAVSALASSSAKAVAWAVGLPAAWLIGVRSAIPAVKWIPSLSALSFTKHADPISEVLSCIRVAPPVPVWYPDPPIWAGTGFFAFVGILGFALAARLLRPTPE